MSQARILYGDELVQAYLQAAHDKNGGFEMAMLMMAYRIEFLESSISSMGAGIVPDNNLSNKGKGDE